MQSHGWLRKFYKFTRYRAGSQYRGSRIYRWAVALIFIVVIVVVVLVVIFAIEERRKTESMVDSNDKKLSLSFEGCISKTWLPDSFVFQIERTSLSVAPKNFIRKHHLFLRRRHPLLRLLFARKSHFWIRDWTGAKIPSPSRDTSLPPRRVLRFMPPVSYRLMLSIYPADSDHPSISPVVIDSPLKIASDVNRAKP